MFIVKVPFINGLGKTKGCEKAGNKILSSLKEIYSNESGKEINLDAFDLEEIHVDNRNVKEANNLIYQNASEIFETKDKTIFLGGDHSISYSLAKSFLDFCNNHKKKPCLVIFDAHPDCKTSLDDEIPTNEKWLSSLVRDGFPKESIFIAGVRNSYISENEFIKKNKIKVMSMNSLLDDLEDCCDTLMEFMKGKEVYLSIDIDVIDPAFASATERKEPGGLTSREFVYLLQRFNKLKNLKSIDIVEINPEKDKDNLTTKLGAKILSELI